LKLFPIRFSVEDFYGLLEEVKSDMKDAAFKDVQSKIGSLKKNLEKAERSVKSLEGKIPTAKLNPDDSKSTKFQEYVNIIKFIEEYRWLGTVCFFTWSALVGLLLISGLSRSSKCCLFLFAAIGMITLVLCWAVVGFYLGISVGAADLCMNTTGKDKGF
jgi:hypothetical protein